MEPFAHTLPVRLVFGPGTLPLLAEECAGRFRRPALVVGRDTLARGGLRERILAPLAERGIVPVDLPPVVPEATCEACDDLARRARAAGADGVLAVGGGSALDAGKAVAMLLSIPEPLPCARYLREWEGAPPPVPGRAPLALVPTTAGTGTEATCCVALLDAGRSHKLAFFHPALYADLALVDPDLTATLPPRVLRRGLFDAFCHLADAYLAATAEFPVSDRVAEALAARLVELSAEPAGDAARAELAHIAWLALSGIPDAGRAGEFPLHDLAAPVSARLGIPHAEALALLFPPLAAFSAADPAARARMARLHEILDPAGRAADLPAFLRVFVDRLGIRPAVAPLPDGTCDLLAADCLTLFGGGRMTVANPAPLHLHEMAEIYREAFAA